MNIEEMNLEQLNARVEEIRKLSDTDDADYEALSKELDKIEARKKELFAQVEARKELRNRVSAGLGDVIETGAMGKTEEEIRAINFARTGIEKRSLLISGKIAKPTTVGGINDLAIAGTEIVDDVTAVEVKSVGTYTASYKKKEATAADVTDGAEIGGTGSDFDYVDIAPLKWGIVDEISNQVTKMTPLSYESKVVGSAVIALREMAAKKIVAAVLASKLAEKVNNAALDENYLRNRALKFSTIAGKGACVLYIGKEDMMTLGAVRGTNEKAPLYNIKFDDGVTTSGIISEGGTSVKFRIVEDLPKGTQLYGQPLTVEMAMWGDYEIKTDASEKFSKDMLVIRGLQIANADLCAYHGMQIVKQGAE